MSLQRTIGLLLLVASILGFDACKKRVLSDKPLQEAFEPPIEDPISYVAGNLTFNIRDLEAKVNKGLSTTLVPEETFEGKKGEAWKLRVERTGPIKISYANRQVVLSAPLQVWYSNPIGLRRSDKRKSRSLCALAVNFKSPIAVGPNWRLITKVKFEKYHWTQEPKVRLLGIKFSVRKIAESILDKRRTEIEHAIDRAVHRGLRLDKQVSKVWRDLQKPLRITKKPENIWLLPKPFSIASAPVYGNAHEITVPIQIAFRVKTHIGERPVISPDSLERLPRLLHRKDLPDSSRLEVLSFVPYKDINEVLDQLLSRKKISLVGGNLTLKGGAVYGSGKMLILKADVGGAVNGTLYLHGQPTYDTLTNTLRVKDVDFDVVTREYLLATADWLLHDHLRDTIQSKLVIPLAKPIATIPEKIETAFAKAKVSKKTDLDIDTFQMVPQRILVQPEGVQVLIKVKSKLAVKMKRL